MTTTKTFLFLLSFFLSLSLIAQAEDSDPGPMETAGALIGADIGNSFASGLCSPKGSGAAKACGILGGLGGGYLGGALGRLAERDRGSVVDHYEGSGCHQTAKDSKPKPSFRSRVRSSTSTARKYNSYNHKQSWGSKRGG